jgi:hypothetical protein
MWNVLSKWLTLLGLFLYAVSSFAINGRTTYQARIVKPDGYPLQSASVNFRFSVLDQSGSCVLYVEDYSAINMTDTAGIISFPLGSGTRSFPTSGTSQTFQNTFDNSIVSFACQAIGIYNPNPTDSRKIVMQFNDGNGWQTLPAMSMNAVPYAMFATKSVNTQSLNGKADTAFVEYATLNGLSCAADQAIKYNGVSFSCLTVGTSATVLTSSTVVAALGYAPVAGTSFTSLDSTITSVSSAVYSVSSTVANLNTSVTSLSNTVAASLAAITSSQWVTSGTAISYDLGNISVSGGVRISMDASTCSVNSAGTLRYNAGVVEYCNGTSWSAFGVAGSGITLMNGSASGSQTFGTGITGTVFNITSVNGVHTFNIPLAASSSVTAGLLSNSDFTTFSNKMNATSAAVVSALGYTPANSSTVNALSAMSASISSDLASVSAAVTAVNASTVASFTAMSANTQATSFTATSGIIAPIIYGGTNAFGDLRLESTTDSSKGNILLARTTGNVGLGTGQPTAKLYVDSDGYSPNIPAAGTVAVFDNESSDMNITLMSSIFRKASLFFANTGATSRGAMTYYFDSNPSLDKLSFTVNSGSVMTLDALNRMGLGTSNPTAMLGIQNTSDIGSFNIKSAPSQGAYWLRVQDSNDITKFMLSPNGAMPQLQLGGTNKISLTSDYGGAYEVPGGAIVNTTNNLSLINSGNPGIMTMAGYYNGSQFLSAWEIANVSSGFGNLLLMRSGGDVGIGVAIPSAKLHLGSGTTTTAALKITSGTLLTSPQSGTIEYDGFNYYVTDGTNTRRAIAMSSQVGSYDNVNSISSTGNLTITPTGSVIVSSTTASTSSNTGSLVVAGGLGVGGSINVAGVISGSSLIKGTAFRANQGTPNAADSSTNGFAFGSDGDTGIFSPGPISAANGVLAFYNNNAETMRINPGAVGIGTTAPGAKLEILSSAASQTVTTKGLAVSTASATFDTTSSDLYNYGAHISAAATKLGANRLYNVGIYATAGGGNLPQAAILDATNSGSNLPLSDNSGVQMAGGRLDLNNVNNPMYIHMRRTNNSFASATTMGSGNILGGVGFGGFDGASFTLGNSTAAAQMRAIAAETWSTSGHGTAMIFSTTPNGSTTSQERMYIDNSGFVGIGTSSPQRKLHISAFGSDGILLDNATTDSPGLILHDSSQGVSGVTWNIDSANGNFRIFTEPITATSPLTATAGNERLLINAQGLVGIGTTAPTDPLHVVGAITAANSSATAKVTITPDFSNSGFIQSYSGPGVFRPLAIEAQKLTFDSHGSGTTIVGNVKVANTQQNVLTTYGSEIFALTLEQRYGAGGWGPALEFRTNDASHTWTNAAIASRDPVDGSYSGELGFFTTAGGGIDSTNQGRTKQTQLVERMRITNSGAVGIGTTAPGEKLEVSGTIQVRSSTTMTGGGNPAGLRIYNKLSSSSSDYLNIGWMGENLFGIQSADELTYRALSLNPYGGNVGIGTSSLTTGNKLEIRGGDTFMEGRAYIYSNSAWGALTPSISLAIGDNDTGMNWVSDGILQMYSNNQVRMHVNATGMGINRIDPAYTLDVAGNFRVTGQAYTDSGAATFTVLSDVRYKDVHGPYERGLSDLLKIGTIRYNYKKENPTGADSTKEYVGVSAQNVQEAIPEAVEKNNKDGKEFLTVNPSAIIFAMINGIKDLYNEIMRHDREIASLKTENEVLKSKMKEFDELKAYICNKDPQAPNCK